MAIFRGRSGCGAFRGRRRLTVARHLQLLDHLVGAGLQRQGYGDA
jgi:hypothetical protein